MKAPNVSLSRIRKNHSQPKEVEAGKNAFTERRKENVADEKGREEKGRPGAWY